MDDGYLLDNRSGEAGQRFDALGALFNPTTFGHIERLGVAPGWRCWEVGVGGPSIPRWLAHQVGPDGWIVASDIDIRWAEAVAGPNVRVLRHDVAVDEPPETGFDLVHERLVLIHVARREEALVEAGHVSDEEIEEHLRAVSAGEVHVGTALLFSAWGRRP